MTVFSRRTWSVRLALGLGLAFTAAACAPQGALPQASAPTSAELPRQPAAGSTTQPSSAMGRTDSMQGMDHSNMQGMQGHNMSGMSTQDMMAHCRQMQANIRPGATMSPDMQTMMAHCNQMGGSGTRSR